MTLSPGTRLGPYEITAAIGAGGMGEVYRARDARLDRDVAIKVLPPELAQDRERLARFEREAKLLASLNHPNIAAIYGIEEIGAGPTIALVMELVEGEDLAERLKRAAIPIDESIAIAKQLADGLEEAHEHGIIHRDLKPANIKVTPDGKVKILDFGLAKAREGDPASSSTSSKLSHSPTMSRHMTEAGMIMGTAAYMSPEQARGKTVDKRTDIWSFGVVVFEMLSGTRLFGGETVSDTLAAVLTRDPDWSSLPGGAPDEVRTLLLRCLQRDTKDRLRDIGEARVALSKTARGGAATDQRRVTLATPAGPRNRVVLIVVAALTFVASIAAMALWSRTQPKAVAPTHLDLAFPTEMEPLPNLTSGFAISPDGRAVAMIGVILGSRRVFVRPLSSDEAFEITDPTGINGVAFSPDSQSVLYQSTRGTLVTFSLADQQRKVVAEDTDLLGSLAWGKPGIVFSRNNALWLAPSGGGPLRLLAKPDPARREVALANQIFLPDGRLLFVSLTSDDGSERIEALSLDGGTRTVVLENANTPLFSTTGHLLFSRDGALVASAFDSVSLTMPGTAVVLMPKGELGATGSGAVQASLSANGDLIFVRSRYQATRVDLVGREGAAQYLPFPSARYTNPRVSPDGRRIMVEVSGLRVEAFDLERRSMSRLSPEAPGTGWPIWNRDGTAAFFRRYNTPSWKTTDGTGQEGQVPGGVTNDYPSGPGPDPDSFLAVRVASETSGDVVLISRTGAFEPKPIVATPAYEGGGQLSPDGKWIVYATNESGRFEIQIRRFPAADRKWPVSSGFGGQPQWRPDGREISYRDGQNIIGVPFDGSKNEPVIGKPAALFRDEYDFGLGLTSANYDRTRDGGFIMLRRETPGISLSLVLNWTEELKQIMSRGAR